MSVKELHFPLNSSHCIKCCGSESRHLLPYLPCFQASGGTEQLGGVLQSMRTQQKVLSGASKQATVLLEPGRWMCATSCLSLLASKDFHESHVAKVVLCSGNRSWCHQGALSSPYLPWPHFEQKWGEKFPRELHL